MMKRPLSVLTSNRLLVSPSMLASDFSVLGKEIEKIEDGNADMVHWDVMDAHFVPNLTMGPALISSLRKYTALPFDTHLMMTNPLNFIKPFSDAGSDHITFHIECDDDIGAVIDAIRDTGCSVGISLRPKTPASALEKIIDKIDLVLVMTVEPGFGGQSFMADVLLKITEIRRMLDAVSSPAHIEVDGGIDASNYEKIVSAGGNILVAGTSIFAHENGVAEMIDVFHSAQKILNSRNIQ